MERGRLRKGEKNGRTRKWEDEEKKERTAKGEKRKGESEKGKVY
jgi:hypothetical protein